MPRQGRLRSRPAAVTDTAPSGLHPLPLGGERESWLYVPERYRAGEALPLVLLLHGSGGHARHGLGLLRHLADEAGLILLAPASSRYTWDVIVDGFGPDVERLDRALEHVFARYAADPARLAIGGFSDGASYALSLGITNGDLFSHVVAFSPGFLNPGPPRGHPRLFLSHGVDDAVLPIARCSRRIAPALAGAGYEVEYREFSGGHAIPPEIASGAVEWFLGTENPGTGDDGATGQS